MSRFRQAVIVLAALALASAMVVLGVWQLDVYHAQGAAAAQRRAEEPPLPLASVARAGTAVGDGYGRAVTFTGRYEPNLQLLVPAAEQPGQFRVLTGLRQADGSLVPVVRGVVSGSGAPPPPSGTVEETGVLLPSEERGSEASLPPGQLATVRVPALAQEWPGPLIAGFVTLSAADAAESGLAPAQLALPEARGRLRNGAYAIQWWLFAGFTVVMGVRMARDLGQADARAAEIVGDSAGGAT